MIGGASYRAGGEIGEEQVLVLCAALRLGAGRDV